jgi:hypothetical protein
MISPVDRGGIWQEWIPPPQWQTRLSEYNVVRISANPDIADLNGPVTSPANNRLFDQLLILAIALIIVFSERVTLMPHCDCAVLVTQTGEDIPKSPKCHSIIQQTIVAREPNTFLDLCGVAGHRLDVPTRSSVVIPHDQCDL